MKRMISEEILFDEILSEEHNTNIYILDNINDYDYFEVLLVDRSLNDRDSKYAKVINNNNNWEIVIRKDFVEIVLYESSELIIAVPENLYDMLRLTIIGGKY